jgi:hypothetical protein
MKHLNHNQTFISKQDYPNYYLFRNMVSDWPRVKYEIVILTQYIACSQPPPENWKRKIRVFLWTKFRAASELLNI